MLVATDSIILRSRKQGDTSKIVTLYTRDYGLVDVIAKGARQQKSKFGAALEPFSCSKIVFYKKEHTNLYLLSSAEVISPLRKISADLEHIEAATRIAELIIRSQHDEEKHFVLFDLVYRTLVLMDANSSAEAIASILFAFYLRYSQLSGFAIEMTKTQISEEPIYFDTERGELTYSSSKTMQQSDRYIMVTPQMSAALDFLRRNGIEGSVSLRLSGQCKVGMESLFRAFFATHLEGMQPSRTKVSKVFSEMKRKKI